MSDKCCQEAFEGNWYEHPPMRNALISGAIATFSFALTHLKIIPSSLEIVMYVAAIAIGGFHWIRSRVRNGVLAVTPREYFQW